MQLLTRLNLRHNWPLITAMLILIASLSILQGMPYKFSKSIPFNVQQTVDYSYVLYRFGGFPVTRVFILLPFGVLTLLGVRRAGEASKSLTAVIILIASASVCAGFTSYFINGDGTHLEHVQTFHQGDITYQLTRVRTIDSGLISDTFWIFRCETDEVNCRYIEYDGRKTYPVISENTLANLVVDPATKTLYLQIGDKKTPVAQ